jgi:hypothetical protein
VRSATCACSPSSIAAVSRASRSLDEALAELYADADPAADERLQLMTIHRAKGLEFDIVIVPSLGRAPGRRAERLLAVHEHADANGSRLLIAPMPAPGQPNTIGRYLQHLEDASDEEEAVRLLYVAATRARSRLHLLGAARLGASGAQPRRDSLLARLWPAVRADFAALPAPAADTTAKLATDTRATIRRLPSSWVLPVMPQVPSWRGLPEPEAAEEAPEFAWAGDVARQVGRAVHRALERIGKDGVARWNSYGAQGHARGSRGLRELSAPPAARAGVGAHTAPCSEHSRRARPLDRVAVRSVGAACRRGRPSDRVTAVLTDSCRRAGWRRFVDSDRHGRRPGT